MSKKMNTLIGIAAISAMMGNNAYYQKQKEIYGSAIYVPKKHKKKYKGYHK